MQQAGDSRALFEAWEMLAPQILNTGRLLVDAA